MSTPKASGKREVRVEKLWMHPGSVYVNYRKTDRCEAPVLLITELPPGLTAAKVKKHVEIAAMDYDRAFLKLSKDGYSYTECGVICGFLGLAAKPAPAQPKARKRGGR
jgi:hypothetical protein